MGGYVWLEGCSGGIRANFPRELSARPGRDERAIHRERTRRS